jgi:hypothetical protein
MIKKSLKRIFSRKVVLALNLFEVKLKDITSYYKNDNNMNKKFLISSSLCKITENSFPPRKKLFRRKCPSVLLLGQNENHTIPKVAKIVWF